MVRPTTDDEFAFPVDVVGGGVRDLDGVGGPDQGVGELGEQGGVLGERTPHLQDVRAVVQPDTHDLPGVRDDGGQIVQGYPGSGCLFGHCVPVLASQQGADVGNTVDDDTVVAVHAGRGGAVGGADGGQLHRSSSSWTRSKCSRSTTGASENRNRSKVSSLVPADCRDQGIQDGTTNRSPLVS